jgi:hypothetical protein
MPEPVLVEGPAALDVIIAQHAQKLAETWPGDEQLVALLIQERVGTTEKTGIVWAPRERVLGDLAGRGEHEQDPRRRARFDNAVASLSAARVPGRVSLVVSGWGDLVVVEVKAEDLRTGKLLTSVRGGSA